MQNYQMKRFKQTNCRTLLIDCKKNPYIHQGHWLPVFEEIDTFLLDLTTYYISLDNQANAMRTYREEKEDRDINKCNKDVSIINIMKSNPSYNKHNNNFLLQENLKLVEPWTLVRLEDCMLLENSSSKNKTKTRNAWQKYGHSFTSKTIVPQPCIWVHRQT